MLLTDKEIRKRAKNGMIEPFVNRQVEEKNGEPVVSYGLSSYGYDVRISKKYDVFTELNYTTVDPKDFDKKAFAETSGDFCIIPPNSFILGKTIERFEIPKNTLGICVGKSTYARCGIIVNITPLEPGWKGKITLEVSNTTPLPAKIYGGEGIAQIVFLESERPEVTYDEKNGKYQGQDEITPAMVKK